jgi:hypothetical protein
MRAIVAIGLIVALLLGSVPAFAEDVEALRREVEQLRKQLQSVTERLLAIEARPAPPPALALASPSSVISPRRRSLRRPRRVSRTMRARISPSPSRSGAGPVSSSSTSASRRTWSPP